MAGILAPSSCPFCEQAVTAAQRETIGKNVPKVLAGYVPGPRDTNILPLNPADWNTGPAPPSSGVNTTPSPYQPPPRPRKPITPGGKLFPEDFM